MVSGSSGRPTPPRRASSSPAGGAQGPAGARRPVSTRAAAGTRGAPAPRTARSRGTTKGRGKPSGPRRLIDYPRRGYTGPRRWLPSWRFLLGGLLGLVFVAFGALVAFYVTLKVPSPSAQVKYQTSTVYFADASAGTRGPQMGQFAQQKRDIVDPTTLPTYLGQAVVSMEDRTFYENSGVDLKGIARAFFNNVTGGAQQGASTLTQQYVERYLVGKTTKDYVGKLREAMLALKISKTEPKDEILGRYLNTIYLGRDSYGVQAAAKAYFNVDAKDLTVEQSALLAGLIPSPNSWDPATAPAKAEARWNLVLDAMVKEGYLDATARAGMKFPTTVAYTPSNTMAGTNGYLLQMVLDELQSTMGLSKDDVNRGGYTIVTTIDPQVQAEAVRAANDLYSGTLAGAAPNPRLRLGITSLDPATGAIVGLYGGPDYLKDSRNTVTYEKIQAGSTFKPYTLIAALEQGIGLKTVFNGKTPQTLKGWDDTTGKSVSNFDNESFGNIDLLTATAASVNTVYAQLNLQVGADKSADVANRAGVTLLQPKVPSNVLGVGDVHVLDQASGYATIAAGGIYSKPHIVAQVLNPDGSVAFTGASDSKRVFSADVMADTTYAMQQPVQMKIGTAHKYISPLGVPIAGKTGTSQDNKSAWFVGFTPKIVTAVAMFQNGEDGTSMESITSFGGIKQVTGGDWPAKLWADYMKPVLAMPAWQATTQFPAPAYVGGKPTPTATPVATDTPPPTETPTQAPSQVAVPDIRPGTLEADAQAALVAVGLQPQVTTEPSADQPAGKVIRIAPAAGTLVAPGQAVTLFVSSGPPPTQAPTTPPATPTSTPSGAAAAGGP